MSETVQSLTAGRLLVRSVIWNFVGMASPVLVALFTIPMLIDGMGKERFGLLSIVWMAVGYFSLFDLGLGRALTKLVAGRLGNGRIDDLGTLIWTALTMLALMGVIGGSVVLVFSGSIVAGLLNVEVPLQAEAATAFRILATGIPIVIVTSALVGLLEAHQRFATITAIRIPLGILTFAGPLITLQFTPNLAWATGALLLSRSLALFAFFIAAASVRTELRKPSFPRRQHMIPLLNFGGWLTVTNIVGPLMTYLDRFFVGAVLNMTAVAYYVTPYEVLSRLQILPRSIMAVVFPAMTTAHTGDRLRFVDLYTSSAKVLVVIMLPVTVGLFLLAPEALQIWLGDDFRDAATPVMQWLAAGWMVNTMARPSLTVLQSTGRPDLVAKTHLAELIPYLLVLWFLTSKFGINGTAAAWTLRVLVDTVILNELTGRKIPELRAEVMNTRVRIVAILAGFATAWFLDSLLARLMLLLVVLIGSGIALWPTIERLRHTRDPGNTCEAPTIT